MRKIYYAHPYEPNSFELVAQQYISMLRKSFTVIDLNINTIYPWQPFPVERGTIVAFHPLFYKLAPLSEENIRKFESMFSTFDYFVGFEVADSDKIAQKWVDLTNSSVDMLIVPSKFSKDVFKKSGVKIDVEVVPHAFNSKLLDFATPLQTDPQLELIKKIKQEKKVKLVTTFIMHSWYRKGGDIFHRIARRIQEERNDVYFLVKANNFIEELADLKAFQVTGQKPYDVVVDIFRTSDVYVLASRGGGFEINGLEALVSGVPTIAPEKGSWVDYFPPSLSELLIRVERKTPVFPEGNPIHIGKGFEMDVERAVDRLHYILDNLDDFKARVVEARSWLVERFSEEAMSKIIIEVFERAFSELSQMTPSIAH